MYRYRAKRDWYHRERDEAHTSLQGVQAHHMGATPTLRGTKNRSSTFVHGIY